MRFKFYTYLPYRWYNKDLGSPVKEYETLTKINELDAGLGFIALFCNFVYLSLYLLCCMIFSLSINIMYGIVIVPILLCISVLIILPLKVKRNIATTHENVFITVQDDGIEVEEVLPYHTCSEKNKNKISITKIKYEDIKSIEKRFENNEVYGAEGIILFDKAIETIKEKDEVKSVSNKNSAAIVFSIGDDFQHQFEVLKEFVERKGEISA